MAEPIHFVALGLNANAPLGGKVFLPARFNKQLNGRKIPNIQLRHLKIVARNQEVPSFVRDWMREDVRYKAWFDAESESPAPELDAVPDETPAEPVAPVVDDVPAVVPAGLEPLNEGVDAVPDETPAEPVAPVVDGDSIFDYWVREDIEEANLTGEEGLQAFAAYRMIDLGDATLKAEVLEVILEWYDANNG